MIYLDTSAALKSIIREEGTDIVRALFSHDAQFVASRLLAAELHSAVERRALPVESIAWLLDRVELVSLDDTVLSRSITLQTGLRTLDALHLATALDLAPDVTDILTFDAELLSAAMAHGLRDARTGGVGARP
mgnify:CR=1 FL=1